jgi:hypothetical protein
VLKSRGKVLNHASAALLTGDSVIIDRCNFNPEQRQHWIKLVDEIQFEIERTRNKKIFKLCMVLPRSNDVGFCSDRAFSRGDDGVHPAGDIYVYVYICIYMYIICVCVYIHICMYIYTFTYPFIYYE